MAYGILQGRERYDGEAHSACCTRSLRMTQRLAPRHYATFQGLPSRASSFWGSTISTLTICLTMSGKALRIVRSQCNTARLSTFQGYHK